MSDFKLFIDMANWGHNQQVESIYITKPQLIDCIETDGNQLKFANRMQYFKPPKKNDYPLDLSGGLEQYKYRSDDFFLDKLSQVSFYIMNKCGDEDKDADSENFEVVADRAVLSKLMETPYKVGSVYSIIKWTICATRYRNKLYIKIEKDDFDEENPRKANSTYHYKFQQYCFTEDPLLDPDTSAAIDESRQLYGIFRTKLKNIKFLYSAEINGIISESKLQDLSEIAQHSLVHTRLIKAHGPRWKKNYRVLSWWTKSYLAGVRDIYVGLRTEDALVREPVQHFFVHEIAENQRWLPRVCNQFLHTFITKVLQTMQGVNCPHTCYEFSFNSEKAGIDYRVHNGKTEYSFLSEPFVDFLQNRSL